MLSTMVNKSYSHLEDQYIEIIKDIYTNGELIHSRNGDTLSINGASMWFSLKNGTLPVITTKKVAVKTCIKELLWFISGKTDNNILNKQNVHIWDDNGTKEFIEKRGLNYRENDLGPVYGHQWRHFNAEYISCDNDYTDKGIDQLKYVIDSLKHPINKFSRRLIISAWNPCQIDEMVLPPCHVLMQFLVNNKNELSCILYQRSGDIGLGVPFNILSYSVLTHIIAKHCGLIPHEFIYNIGNAHIYEDHIENLKLQSQRKPFNFPTINIKNKYDSIDEYKLEDIDIIDYKYHPSIKLNMHA